MSGLKRLRPMAKEEDDDMEKFLHKLKRPKLN